MPDKQLPGKIATIRGEGRPENKPTTVTLAMIRVGAETVEKKQAELVSSLRQILAHLCGSNPAPTSEVSQPQPGELGQVGAILANIMCDVDMARAIGMDIAMLLSVKEQ